MPINIFKYDGTLLTTVADGTVDTTHSTLKFPGTGYQNYGPPIMENILWTMQNFAGTSQPTLPLIGQTWFDTTSNLLKVYTGSTWQAAGGVLVSSSLPSNPANLGAFWYDPINMQMYVWNGAVWDLIGPLGSAVNTDPIPANNTAIPTFSKLDTVRITDSASARHQVWRIIIGGVLFAIISKDTAFTPAPAITGFATIQPGINFNTTVAGVGISGDTTTFRSNQDNLPDADGTRSLGSSSFRLNTVSSLSGAFSNSLLINTASSTYNFHVTGSSYLNGPTMLAAGTASAAPVQLQTGPLLTTPAVGAMEFDGTNIYITLDVGGTPTRSVIAAGTSGGSTSAVPNTLALRDNNADIYANIFQGIASSARYADVAERYETDMPVEPGDVVVIGGSKEITKSTVENDSDVFGVVSTNPAYRMNEDAGNDTTHPFVAMLGRVPCKVSGTVKKGQRLVTSDIPGVAIAATHGVVAHSFARSLVTKDTDDVAVIEVVITGTV